MSLSPCQQTLGPILEKLTQTASPSRISLWQQCRLRFYFRHVLKLEKPRTSSLHLGSSVHETLRQWNRARWRGEPLSLKQLHEAFTLAWNTDHERVDWEDTAQDTSEKATGWRILETYLRETPIPQEEKPLAVEVSVEADLERHGLPRLVGILDLVRGDGTIVDFKTSSQTPIAERVAHQHETQTTCYSLLYRSATGAKEKGFELHHLVKLKNPKLVVTSLPQIADSQKERLFRILESYLEGMARRDFVPSPGMQCTGCEFFNECRLWQGS